MQLNPYLMFKGDCETAFNFYAECLGGKIEGLHTFDTSPMGDKMPPEWRKKVMHARLSIAGNILMGSDPPPERYQPPQGFSVCFEASAPAEAERVFEALAKGGQVHMPIQKTFWAARYGMLTDQFGIPWMVNCEKGD